MNVVIYSKYPGYFVAKVTFFTLNSLFYNVDKASIKEIFGVITLVFNMFFEGKKIASVTSLLVGIS